MKEMETDEVVTSEELFEAEYSPIFAADIASQKIEPPPFLFSPIFRSCTISMISAEPFTGKTLLMLAMLLSIDTARPLLGRFAPLANQRCAFLGQDAPTWDYHAQFLKLFYGMRFSSEEEKNVPMPSLMFLNRGLSITSNDFVDFVHSLNTIYGVSVVFIDTLLEFHPFDENSNREMSGVMRRLKTLRDKLGITIIFSHHLAKVGTNVPTSLNYRARGASVIGGTVDHHIVMSLRDITKDGPCIGIDFAKGRGLSLRDNPIPYFTIASWSRGDGKESLSLTPAPPSIELLLLEFLTIERERNDIEAFIAHTLKITPAQSRSRASRVLSALRDEGKILQKEYGKWEKCL